ncbi:pyruvate decarboxylase family protein [Klebsormidium nitens]|uniref:2-hydroxyacyl-CoA lyase n=1 Tax=Klebsormidium nitens TaxID=105231 RepID=A0A0U9HI27_KLENI|nr:pyruvate decarboxylase family protein [Klebsormidium nitens]|eukprot:GAQ80211.1 pyruvate decarboxylase family protein [Klebsormidium nitens]
MPRTATGKIQRRKVAEHFLGAAEKAEKAGQPLKEVATSSVASTGTSQAKPVDGADLVARSLAKMGVKYLFGVVGIPVTALATFAQKAGIRFIGLRNEQAAGYAAGAAGYLTGVPGALLTVSGPGAVHGLAGLSNGLANSWPIVMISGSAPTEEVGRGGFQEFDQIAIVKPFVKYAGRAENVRAVPNTVQSAVSAAAAGRPGAAYVDVPAEVLHQEVSEAEAAALLNALVDIQPFYTPGGLRKALSAPPPDVAAAVSLLRNARSPLVVFGKGAAYAHAEDGIRSLVDRTGIPFIATPMGKGVVPDSHPLNAGAARSLALAGADVALVVGAQLNWLLHFGEPPRWGKDVKFIQIDISEDELKLRKPAVPLLGDANAVLEQINVAIKDEPFSLGKDHPWVAKLREKAEANGKRLAESLAKDVVPMNFQCSMRVVRDELAKVEGPHPILVSEGANTMDVGRTVLNQEEPRTRLDAGTWGTMGVGMGYAIAAAVVNDGKRLVVAVEGDSAFGFSAVEVEVLVRYNLPVVVIVFNNSGIYGGDRREDAELGGPYASDPAPTDFVSEARYDQIIEAFGGKGYFVRTPAELVAACREAFAAKKPAVINAVIDPFAGSESGRMHSRN